MQDSAVIGIGLLGLKDAIDRLRELAAQAKPDKKTVTDQLERYTRQHYTWALKRCGE